MNYPSCFILHYVAHQQVTDTQDQTGANDVPLRITEPGSSFHMRTHLCYPCVFMLCCNEWINSKLDTLKTAPSLEIPDECYRFSRKQSSRVFLSLSMSWRIFHKSLQIQSFHFCKYPHKFHKHCTWQFISTLSCASSFKPTVLHLQDNVVQDYCVQTAKNWMFHLKNVGRANHVLLIGAEPM